jgi:hypothetical protein
MLFSKLIKTFAVQLNNQGDNPITDIYKLILRCDRIFSLRNTSTLQTRANIINYGLFHVNYDAQLLCE